MQKSALTALCTEILDRGVVLPPDPLPLNNSTSIQKSNNDRVEGLFGWDHQLQLEENK